MRKLKFTVIGYYEYSGETFAYHILARNPQEAIALAVGGDYIDMSDSSDVAVLGAVNGWVGLTAACEDTGKVAYASDLTQEEANA